MELQRDELRKARKNHTCDVCGVTIKAGDQYYRRVCTYEGYLYDNKECLACQPVISEYCRSDSYDEGYCGEYIQEWWIEEKCPACRHYYQPCEPNEWCLKNLRQGAESVHNCDYRTNDGKCKDEPCEDMTHYCRCEKWEK